MHFCPLEGFLRLKIYWDKEDEVIGSNRISITFDALNFYNLPTWNKAANLAQ
jgi:hypothetical protein